MWGYYFQSKHMIVFLQKKTIFQQIHANILLSKFIFKSKQMVACFSYKKSNFSTKPIAHIDTRKHINLHTPKKKQETRNMGIMALLLYIPLG